jgi:hypothetical protein
MNTTKFSTNTNSEKKLAVMKVFKEGWSLVRGVKLPVFVLSSLLILVAFVQTIIIFANIFPPLVEENMQTAANHQAAAPYFDYFSLPASTLLLMVAIYLVCGSICYFLTAMLMMLGVRKSLGLTIKMSLIFNECKKVWLKIFALFIVEVLLVLISYPAEMLVSFGLAGKITYQVFQVVSGYISMGLMIFSLPLLVIKPTTQVTAAIKSGIQKMNANWLAMILLFIIFFLLGALSVLTLGIAFIWFFPLCYTTSGVCFRDAYGASCYISGEDNPGAPE